MSGGSGGKAADIATIGIWATFFCNLCVPSRHAWAQFPNCHIMEDQLCGSVGQMTLCLWCTAQRSWSHCFPSSGPQSLLGPSGSQKLPLVEMNSQKSKAWTLSKFLASTLWFSHWGLPIPPLHVLWYCLRPMLQGSLHNMALWRGFCFILSSSNHAASWGL